MIAEADKDKLAAEEKEERLVPRIFSPIQSLTQCDSDDGVHRRTFSWEAISYHVPVTGGTRRLLHDVYGYVKPGTLTALMGASGAGTSSNVVCPGVQY